MIVKLTTWCQYGGCQEQATTIACDLEMKIGPACFCDKHADEVANKTIYTEFVVTCPNCKCLFGQ